MSVAGLAVPPEARAQPCAPSWDRVSTIGNPGLDGPVYAMVVFDDGTGPALYVGGQFSFAGGAPANCIAKWDGATWSPLGSGLEGIGSIPPVVLTLAVFDDGTGPALYAGGHFWTAGGVQAYSSIAKWDGAAWSALAPVSLGDLFSMAVFDDGTGPALYVGGNFQGTGGPNDINGIVRWDGVAWSRLGAGTQVFGVRALCATQSFLYAGGSFTKAGGAPASAIAAWDGSSWSTLGSGMFFTAEYLPSVLSLTVFDDGTGPALYAGGAITSAGGVPATNMAKWDGAAWSPLGSGVDSYAYAQTVFDDGTGPALYVGGVFMYAGGGVVHKISRWDGATWSPLGNGLNAPLGIVEVSAMAVFDDGTGPALYVGGQFSLADWGTPDIFATNNIVKWNGCPPCTVTNADLTGDGVVNGVDLSVVLNAWGACPVGGSCAADLTGDGSVNGADLAIILNTWGPAC